MYTIEQAMSVVNAQPTLVAFLAICTYAFGFWQYGTSMYMQFRNKKCPFYFWQHAWYFGHDLTFVLLFSQWFNVIDFWLFKVLWAGCVAFVGIEIWSLYMVVKNERDEDFGRYYKGGRIGEGRAWIRGILGYAAGFLLFQVIRLGIGDPMCLVLMFSTNVTLAIATQFRAEEIGESQRGMKSLAVATFLGTALSFAPPGIGFFSTVIAPLSGTWFYVLGAFSLACAGRLCYLAFTLPKRSRSRNAVDAA
jgi:hypothetical protein